MATSSENRLRRFPNTAIGIVLGLGGQALLWKNVQGWPSANVLIFAETLNWCLWIACVCSLAAFLVLYMFKAISHPDIVLKEWQHPIRFNFLLGPPCIAACFVAMALPTSLMNNSESGVVGNKVGWLICFILQTLCGGAACQRWIYRSCAAEAAAAPYLLCIVSHFLLAVWGQAPNCRIDDLGLPFVEMSFGIGFFWLAIVYPFILTGIYPGRTKVGHPALFLMLAPPSAAAIALGGPDLMGSFGGVSEAIFGAMVVLLVLLLSSGPQLFQAPEVLGVYWAYVFPPGALAILAIKIAQTRQTLAMDVVCWILVILAAFLLLVVFARMSAHQLTVMRGNAIWDDPLVRAVDAAAQAAVIVAEVDESPPAHALSETELSSRSVEEPIL